MPISDVGGTVVVWQAVMQYQRAEMLTHHALEMLKHRTGLTKAR